MNSYPEVYNLLGHNLLVLYTLLAWSLAWKGLALWKASQRKEKIWFVVLLVLNTLGLLEILYLFVFSKEESQKKKVSKKESEEESEEEDKEKK
ncbi:MAG: DUF5652 family protein [Minisyncoccia bacterium]